MSVQSTIETNLGAMPPSLARVATAVREKPSIVIDMTINELAANCATSVASVVRFCRAIGLSGYAALRMALATEIGRESVQFADHAGFGSDISPADSLQDAAGKVAVLERLAIESTIASLDYEVLAFAVDAIDKADRILLFGVGASQIVAQDLGHKLLRVGRNAIVLTDAHEAVASAVLRRTPTVSIAFSHLGATPETIRFMEVGRENGATTIGVTSSLDGPFAKAVDHALYTEVRESRFRAGAMVSRIAQLAVVDALFIGVAQRRHNETVQALERTREATRALRGA